MKRNLIAATAALLFLLPWPGPVRGQPSTIPDLATDASPLDTDLIAVRKVADSRNKKTTRGTLRSGLEAALTFSTGLTRATNTITANLSTGVSGGQTATGGTAAGDDLTLHSTSHGTKGSIFFGAHGAYDQANGRFGFGTLAPDVLLTASANSAALPAAGLAGQFIHIGQADATNLRVLLDSFGGVSTLDFRRADGTAASPTALASGATIGALVALGRGSTAYSTGARASFSLSTDEAWSDTAQGTRFSLSTTANGTTTQTERFRIDNAGNFGVNLSAWGTSAAKVIGISSGTAPSTSPANAVQLWVADSAADDANLYARNEAGKVERLTGLSSRVSMQFDKASSAALANITGLTFNLPAGSTNSFRAVLYTTSDTAGGIQVAVGGTATATAIRYEGISFDGAAVKTQTRATALGGAVCAVTAVSAAKCELDGTITVNAAGTLTVQFAQNASNGNPSSVLVGSFFTIQSNN